VRVARREAGADGAVDGPGDEDFTAAFRQAPS
jgi:hypothetical protein